MLPDILHPTQINRAKLLIEEIIHRLDLDLQESVILTEMGSSYYVYTPMIAALAGAKRVYTMINDSRFGTIQHIRNIGEILADKWNVLDKLEVVTTLSKDAISDADIVTNLGFLRPIDKDFISTLKYGAVIPYMREAWEYRHEDVDIKFCQERNIPVMGTNENYGSLDIFSQCGPLAAKMIFEAGLELKDNNIIVASQDKFGDVISSYLRTCKANVTQLRERNQSVYLETERLDALVIANFDSNQLIVGAGGWIEPEKLVKHHPECSVIHFIGNVDKDSLTKHGIRCIPESNIGAKRMAQTLSSLGPKPVIDLHAAGLKVGELMWNLAKSGFDSQQIVRTLGYTGGLCQPINY